jgi:hypothetical protein
MFEDIDLLCADLAAERWQVYTHARHAKSGFLSRLMDEVTACRAQMGPCAMTQVCTWFLDYRLGYISSQILQCHCSVHVRPSSALFLLLICDFVFFSQALLCHA